MEIRELKSDHADYPQRALELPGRPRVFRTAGDVSLFGEGPILAVLGTREPAPEVRKATRRIVEVASEFAMVVLSGISPGVDVAAHEAALDTGLKTIAVPGCGLHVLLESDRGDLARRIVDEGGLLASPFPNDAPETPDRRWWRNRILAALCHGLMVVASEPDGGAWEAHRWARRLERRLIEPELEMTSSP